MISDHNWPNSKPYQQTNPKSIHYLYWLDFYYKYKAKHTFLGTSFQAEESNHLEYQSKIGRSFLFNLLKLI